MFDVKEMEGKSVIEYSNSGVRVTDIPETGSVIYLYNKRTKESFKIQFTKQNGTTYKVDIDFDSNKASKSAKLYTNGKICSLIFKSIVNLYIKNDKLNIVAAAEFNVLV